MLVLSVEWKGLEVEESLAESLDASAARHIVIWRVRFFPLLSQLLLAREAKPALCDIASYAYLR